MKDQNTEKCFKLEMMLKLNINSNVINVLSFYLFLIIKKKIPIIVLLE